MLLVALAGLAGLTWGVADFAGGKASRRADAFRVVWVSKLVSLPLLGTVVVLTGSSPAPAALGWGLLAGVVGTAGTALFYRALSIGPMAVAASVTSVTSAALPVLVGLLDGERPSAPALAGVGCALLAVTLVSRTAPRTGDRPPGAPVVALATGAGVGFALFMVCLARAARATPADDASWSLLSSHLTGLVLGGALFLLTRRRGRDRTRPGWPRGRGLVWSCAAGLLDTGGSAGFLVASHHGDLSLVAPVAALYPVTTVLLALVVDRERIRRQQVAGLVLAVAALQLVAHPSVG